jgi:hypothetical protein
MRNIFNLIAQVFHQTPKSTAMVDNTVYQVETNSRKYCGRIIYQDDQVIRLRGARYRSVKIIKSNIEKISIVSSEATAQYQDWLRTKPNLA